MRSGDKTQKCYIHNDNTLQHNIEECSRKQKYEIHTVPLKMICNHIISYTKMSWSVSNAREIKWSIYSRRTIFHISVKSASCIISTFYPKVIFLLLWALKQALKRCQLNLRIEWSANWLHTLRRLNIFLWMLERRIKTEMEYWRSTWYIANQYDSSQINDKRERDCWR